MAERPGPWSDERLDRAFVDLVVDAPPPGLAAAVEARIAAMRRPSLWHLPALRSAPARAVALAVVIVAVAAVGSWSLGGRPLMGSGFTVHPGPGGTSTLDAGEFRFDYPSAWSVADASSAFSGGSSIAVLGTLPVESRCGGGHVDINCVYEQRLDPGTIRVFVGTGSYRGGTILDRPDAVSGTTTRMTIGGMPAIRDDHDIAGSYYGADLDLAWSIGRPSGLSGYVEIEAMAREPATAAARAAAEALVASFAFASPLPTLSADHADGVRLARASIAASDASWRQGWGQTAGANHYSCQPRDPDVTANVPIRFSAGGDLGGDVPVTCSWSLGTEAGFWRLELHVDWTAAGRSGRYVETVWIAGDGTEMARQLSGESPPALAGPISTPTATVLTRALTTTDVGNRSCAGVGLLAVLHGSPSDPAGAWLESFPAGGDRREVVWPVGFTARFAPMLEVVDGSGRVVGREGDFVNGSCGSISGRALLVPPLLGLRLECGPVAVMSCGTGLVFAAAQALGWPTRDIASITFTSATGDYRAAYRDGTVATGHASAP